MLSKRYTILLADRDTGVTRRFTVSIRGVLVALVVAAGLGTIPLLIGVGARLSASVELSQLQAANQALRLENDSYRAVTGELTTQITSLQGVVTDLGSQAATPAQQKAIASLPALVRNRATGGASPLAATRSLISAMVSPEDTFGALRDLLGVLEDRLRLVRNDAERWQALASATPSMWPVVGWLTAGYGVRSDPFTGERAQHLGLDISANRGLPIYATAHGRVDSAAYRSEYGNLVVIDHDFGLTTRYAHLSRFAVKAGDRVQRGDIIGYVGSTGRSTSPHLHYEVWANGRPINPLKLLVDKPTQAARP
jgi:murein DD-endopeptidase MepM/ murein hydrolase activator NlpD